MSSEFNMEFADFILRFLDDNYTTIKPLGDRAMDLGAKPILVTDEEQYDLTKDLYNYRQTKLKLKDLLLSATRDKGGHIDLQFAGHIIFRVFYDGLGNHEIHLMFMKGKAKDFFTQLGDEIARFRKAFIENYSEEDLFDLIDISADFLAQRQGAPFSYTLFADEKPFLDGNLNDQDFDVQLLDPMVYIKTLLFVLEGANFLNVKLSSPMDLLKLFESMQNTIRYLATSFQGADLRINAGASGQAVFAAGRDIKPNFTMNAFGPITLQLDNLFKIVSSVLSKT